MDVRLRTKARDPPYCFARRSENLASVTPVKANGSAIGRRTWPGQSAVGVES